MKKWIAWSLLVVVGLPLQGAHISLRNFRELNAALETITEIKASSAAIDPVFRKVRTLLPVNGEVSELSSPMLLGLMELSGAYCKEMVTTQSQTSPGLRRYFSNVDFLKGVKQFGPALRSETTEELTDAFWMRKATIPELNLVLDNLDRIAGSFQAGGPAGDTGRLLFLLCVQMATSLAFITY
jgi:hypothetical protein